MVGRKIFLPKELFDARFSLLYNGVNSKEVSYGH